MDQELYTFMTTFQLTNQIPPKKVQMLNTDSKGAIRGLDFNESTGRVFASCADDGRVYCFQLNGSLRGEIALAKAFTISGPNQPRTLIYVPAIQQLAVGYQGGIIAFYGMNGSSSPICKLKRLTKNTQR